MDLSNVGDLVAVESLDVVLFHEGFDVLLDIGDLRWKAGLHLLDDFLNKLDVFHLLARLHDADDGGLGEHVCQYLGSHVEKRGNIPGATAFDPRLSFCASPLILPFAPT